MDLRPLLEYIDPATITYQDWVNVGMALSKEGYPVDVWDKWSQRDMRRYHDGECYRKWDSFRGAPTPVTGATITEMAKQGGWTPHRAKNEGRALDWDDEINDEMVIVDQHYLQGIEIPQPGPQWDGARDMIKYLSALFDSEDRVCYVSESWEKDGRYVPKNGGHSDRTAGELIRDLERCHGDVAAALGDYNHAAGVWVRFNPLDGKGYKNENVTDYRYALVESDTLEVEKQNEIIRNLELPVAALVYSGKKSVHAIVRVDAPNYEEYRQRVDYLYKVCLKNGFQVDGANRNPSRLSRMPGVVRGDNKQFLIDTNIGKPGWNEWKEWFEAVNDDLPDPEGLADVWNNMPDLAPPLIDGVLRQGHKMLIAGPSKAGKSFALIELCRAIAEGDQWMGFPCAMGRILYVNLELDRASCLHRFKDVYAAMGTPPIHINNIDIWNLRGKSLPMDKLAPKLIRRAQKKNYIAIVIDPIYKIITGDENSADQMAHFCNQFDKVCTELGCAVIYCHHHSKGNQGMKRSMDRASGSGVFARDPDAMLDMIQLCTESDDSSPSAATAWRIDGTLREFPKFAPVNVWFEYPLHKVDDTGLLKMACEDGDLAAQRKKGSASAKKKAESRKASIGLAYDALKIGGDVTVTGIAEYLGVSEKTCRRYIKDDAKYTINDGTVWENKDS
jgi:RecA-family ATPase